MKFILCSVKYNPMKELNLLLLFFLVVFHACRDAEEIPRTQAPKISAPPSEEMTQLGEKLENPYTVENMQQAFYNLQGNSKMKTSISASDINTTHLYVRFLPKTDEEYQLLTQDTSLELYDYPLDYELAEGGLHYHDPQLPKEGFTWKYCALKHDYQFPNVQYEVLEELFIPESVQEETKFKTQTSLDFLDKLEEEALKITHNWEETPQDEVKGKKWWERTSWRPSGRISMFDNSPEFGWNVSVRGAKVRVRSWFTTKHAYTNSDGFFQINHSFKGYVNYSIVWERADYDIRYKRWRQAYYNGPRLKEQAWNLVIPNGTSMSRMYATIHRAAHRYYYEPNFGLRRPPRKNEMFRKLTIGAFNWWNVDLLGNIHQAKRFSTFPEIRIFRPQRVCRDIYATTIHELTHASHWNMDRYNFGQYNKNAGVEKNAESWARGVQWALTRLEYNNYLGGPEIRPIYTNVVLDMIDFSWDRNNGWDDDRVHGYTIRQIEDALVGQREWNGWRDNIKNRYNNETEENLDALFAFWDN